eukprot:7386596-Prymnesium_polylepis.3
MQARQPNSSGAVGHHLRWGRATLKDLAITGDRVGCHLVRRFTRWRVDAERGGYTAKDTLGRGRSLRVDILCGDALSVMRKE